MVNIKSLVCVVLLMGISGQLVAADPKGELEHMRNHIQALELKIQLIQLKITARDVELANVAKKRKVPPKISHSAPMMQATPIVVLDTTTQTSTAKTNTPVPWNPDGYEQSVARAKKTYASTEAAKCAQKVAKYKTKYELHPKNEYYVYKLEYWRNKCKNP